MYRPWMANVKFLLGLILMFFCFNSFSIVEFDCGEAY